MTTTMPAVGTTRRSLLLSLRGTTAATLLMYACNLVVVPVLLHRIGSDLYGAWATIASLLAVGGLADAGVRTEIVRRVGAAKGRDDDAELAGAVHNGVSLLTFFAGLLLFVGVAGAPLLRAFAFPDGVAGYSAASIDWLVRATFAVLAVELVVNGHFAVLRGLQRADAESLAVSVSTPFGVAAAIVGVVQGWGLWALLLGSVVQLTIQGALQLIAARRLAPGLRFRVVRIDRATARAFTVLGGLALLSQVGDVIDTQWDKVVLSRYVGSSAVAAFQIGTTLVLQAKVLALIPVAPIIVAVAELGQSDNERLRHLCRRLGRVGAVAAATVFAAVFVLLPPFVDIWLGDAASPQIHELGRIFIVAVAINVWSAPLAFRAFGAGWHRLPAVGSVVNIGVNAVASLVLTLHAGYRGPVIGSVLGNFAGVAVFTLLMRRRLGAEWERPVTAPYVVGAGVVGLAVLLGA